MANISAAAADNLAESVAKLWARSFGVGDAKAIDRLKAQLQASASQAFASGVAFAQMQGVLDREAEKIIRGWFAYVLGQEIPSSARYLAVIRLAFLDCNFEGKWSPSFLAQDFCIQELSSELNAVMIMPTPEASRREMIRQPI